jgi:hypothetical protein
MTVEGSIENNEVVIMNFLNGVLKEMKDLKDH